jgi:uncharacterized membrane protein YecN with MAPEG domain
MNTFTKVISLEYIEPEAYVQQQLEVIVKREEEKLTDCCNQLLMIDKKYQDKQKEFEAVDRQLCFLEQTIEVTDIEDLLLKDYESEASRLKMNLTRYQDELFSVDSEMKGLCFEIAEQKQVVLQMQKIASIQSEGKLLSKDNNNALELIEQFPTDIKDSVQTEWCDIANDYDLILKYSGHYTKEITEDKKVIKKELIESVEEVIYQERVIYDDHGVKQLKVTDQFLVTKEIGHSEPEKYSFPNTRISLVYVENEQVKVWVPTIEEIILIFDRLYHHYDKHHYTILRQLNYSPIRFEISDIQLYQVDHVFDEEVKRDWFNDPIPIKVFYALLKQMMISEDIRYPKVGQFGREMIMTAITDYIHKKVPIEQIRKWYNLKTYNM